VDDEHIHALVEAVYGANLNTIGILAPDTGFVDDVSHIEVYNKLTTRRSSAEFKSKVAVSRSLIMSLLSVTAQELRAALTGLPMMLPNVSGRRSAKRAGRSRHKGDPVQEGMNALHLHVLHPFWTARPSGLRSLGAWLRVLRAAGCGRLGVRLRCVLRHVFAGDADNNQQNGHDCRHNAKCQNRPSATL